MRTIAIFLLFALGLFTCASPAVAPPKPVKEQPGAGVGKVDWGFPFIAMGSQGHYCVIVPLASDSIRNQYGHLFKKYGYTGSGFTWQSHIRCILSKLDPQLLSRLTMDPENSDFFVFMQSEKDLERFTSLVVPVYHNLPGLEAYIKQSGPEW